MKACSSVWYWMQILRKAWLSGILRCQLPVSLRGSVTFPHSKQGTHTCSRRSPCCSCLVYNLPLILLLTEDRWIFLLVSHWQIMISFGHIISSRLLCSFCSPPIVPTPSLLPTLLLLHSLSMSSENSSDKVEHLKFRSVSSKQLCTGSVPLCH